MSDILKCPFCGEELNIDPCGEMGCPNGKCKESVFLVGTEELWEALIDSMKEYDLCHDALVERTKELNNTKKKLDIAVDALFDVHKHSYACCNPASEIGYIHAASYNALEKTCNEFEQINDNNKG